MANIKDYLSWRGDLPFTVAPFNEVDNLILSVIAYVDLKGVVPGPAERQGITLRDASRLYDKMHFGMPSPEILEETGRAPQILKMAAESLRFRGAVLSRYKEIFDPRKDMQFGAMHITLDDGSTYVAFRGTDDTLTGWKEDFNMAVSVVPSQLEAKAYLEQTVKGIGHKYRVGGHSKGGNLAVYSATQSSPAVRNRIISVYNNDGPGFHKELLRSPGYVEMLPRICILQPFASMVGMLMNQRGRRIIVSSEGSGLMQHEALNWQVQGTRFVREEQFTDGSIAFRRDIQKWLCKYSKDEIKKMISDLFMVMEVTGANSLSEVTEYGLHNIKVTMKTIVGLDRDARIGILDFFRILFIAKAADEARIHKIPAISLPGVGSSQ